MIKIKKQFITFFILLFTSYSIFSANFNVTNSSDAIPAPAGSLRQAIIDLNNTGNPNNLNTVTFLGNFTINLVANLDPISKPVRFVNASQVVLDGTSITTATPPGDAIGLNFILGSEGSIIEGLTIQNFRGADGFFNPFNHPDGFQGVGIRVGRADITIDTVTIRDISGGNAVNNNRGGTAYGVLSGQDQADRAIQILNCQFLGQFSGGNGGSGTNSSGGDVNVLSCSCPGKIVTLYGNDFNCTSIGGNGDSGGNVFAIAATNFGQFIINNNNFDCISTGGNGINGNGGLAFTFGFNSGAISLTNNKLENSSTNTGGDSTNGLGGSAATISYYQRSMSNSTLTNGNELNGTNTGGNSTNNNGGYAVTIRFACSKHNILSNNKINNINIGGNGINGGYISSVIFTVSPKCNSLPCGGSNNNLAEKNSITEFHVLNSQPGIGTISNGQAFGFLVDDENFDNSILSNFVFGNAIFPGIFLRGTGNHNQPSPNITAANFCI